MDRDANNESIIDSKYKYRKVVLVNTRIFIGNIKPYDMFRTFTHEIGHWCGLLHPFDNNTCKSTVRIKYGL